MSAFLKRGTLAAVGAVAIIGLAGTANADLVLNWNFDEASGPALDTGAAPANSGTLFGAARSADTPSGTGSSIDLRDDGSTYNYVATDGDPADLDGLGDLTLTTWLKLESYPGTGSSSNARLIAKQEASTFDGFNWSLNSTVPSGTASETNVTMALFLGGTTFAFDVADEVSFDASEWTFLAVSYDAATGATTYYTGGVDTPVTQYSTATIAVGAMADSDAAVGVGFTGAAPTADTSAIGWQDDVRIYNEVLDSGALDAIRLANVPEPTTAGILALAAGGLVLRRRR